MGESDVSPSAQVNMAVEDRLVHDSHPLQMRCGDQPEKVLGASRSGDARRRSQPFAMEGKPADVPKMLQVMARCVSEGKIPAASIVFGFADPLEFLGDIEIDAPLAGKHLAQIVSECLKLNALTLDFLVKESPENFRTSGLAAKFACQVLKQRGTDPSEEDWQVVESLMTPEETKQFESPKAMW